jgi:hypothetical protein
MTSRYEKEVFIQSARYSFPAMTITPHLGVVVFDRWFDLLLSLGDEGRVFGVGECFGVVKRNHVGVSRRIV